MPKISQFYGIEIQMYWYDHAPPHFHAIYDSSGASITIETSEITHGSLPPRVAGMVREWSLQHTAELRED
ncbi:MAG: DUF4160 domain-containing protein [Planctomycetaceae bacterium]